MKMQKSTFKVSFVAQKGKLRKNGKAPILARITVNGKFIHIATQFETYPEKWKNGKIQGLSKEDKATNIMLDNFKALVWSKFNEIRLRGEYPTPEKIRNMICHLDNRTYTLLEHCENWIQNYEMSVKAGDVTRETYARYILTKNRLAEFISKKYNQKDILLADINHDFIQGFDRWQRCEYKLENNTASRFIKHFRTMFNNAIHNGWIQADPFANYKIKLVKIERDFLTKEDLEKLINATFHSKRLEVIKDMFLFSCYTGLAYIDVRNLRYECIIQKPDGKFWISTKREKTGNPVKVVLLPLPLEIIEKYRGETDNGKVLPIPSNQKVNDYLKEVATICRIDKNLTFHVARHTFATTVTLTNGVSLETVSKMLGHSSVKTTQIYAKIVDEKINEEMARVEKRLFPSAKKAKQAT